MVCAQCGTENVGDAKFCKECGAPLAAASPAREQRKTVTILFCDVTESTALGERLDPEAVRALLSTYFDRMKAIVESHGGTVEKFIGDAVMAVFGVPVVHEDDALRACRAAVEMRDALPTLGIGGRIGVMTGEVVTGTVERLATGDAVNVAARLEQAAEPGEILIGDETYQLVEEAAEVELLDALVLKGKAQSVRAYRLLAVAGELSRRNAAPMVGREMELRRLGDAFAQAVRDRSCQLFTVLGSAGVGKSRLVSEFLLALDATVVAGRCLSYGDGITYWPVVEIVKQVEAIQSRPVASGALGSIVGESDSAASADEIAWAFRKLLEEQATGRPLVCVFDDLHWAEGTLLDLVEHVADLSRDAPILMVCMARPDLLELRPAWGGGKWNATAVLLEPLDATETEQLLDELGGVGEELRERIAVASEGNPLFLEEMLALVRESGDEQTVIVPPTIQALLAARLDQLDPSERSVLERGSIEGRLFHQGSVSALSDGDVEVPRRLLALVRKELVRPSRAEFGDGDAFRFRHLLIRDAAYNGLPKSLRAELHERFADWLEPHSDGLVETDEILGYHLEQAALYGSELGRPNETLAARAGDRLATAGRRALARGDFPAASTLLGRAGALLRAVKADIHLELDLALAVFRNSGRPPGEAAEILDAAAKRADREGAATHVLLASFLADCYRVTLADEPDFEELDERARRLIALLEDVNDHLSLVHVWTMYGVSVSNFLGHYEGWTRATEQANRHARLAGEPSRALAAAAGIVMGPRPADVALEDLDEFVTGRPFRDFELLLRAWLLAMLGRHDEARNLSMEAFERLREMRGPSGLDCMLAAIWALGGDHESAARYFRISCDFFEWRGNRHNLSCYAPMLARELCFLGRYDEAEPFARTGRDLADPHDAFAQTLWRQATALVESEQGNHSVATTLAREAVAFAEQTDALNVQGDAYLDLAEVLDAAGESDEAQRAFSAALDRYDRKKNVAMADQVRTRLTTRGGTARA